MCYICAGNTIFSAGHAISSAGYAIFSALYAIFSTGYAIFSAGCAIFSAENISRAETINCSRFESNCFIKKLIEKLTVFLLHMIDVTVLNSLSFSNYD